MPSQSAYKKNARLVRAFLMILGVIASHTTHATTPTATPSTSHAAAPTTTASAAQSAVEVYRDRDAVNRGFQEVAPVITKVSVVQGDPFIEVFVSGYAPEGDCYDKKEYVIDNLKTETRIVARFRRNNPDTPCKSSKKEFTEKAADLDPAKEASKTVYVLGLHGWHLGTLETATPALKGEMR